MTNKELWEIANRERLWLTAEEFYAQIEAHKAARLNENQAPRKPFQPGPFVREYRLWDGNWIFRPKVKAPIASKPEVMP
jgi:hypothetical protein